MELKKILECINKIAPEDLQEDWDNSGIQINAASDGQIKRIMTCLEISDSVIDEAIKRETDMIVTHHPLIFSKLNKIDSGTVAGNQIIKLIQHGITVYSSHTAFDSAIHGTNQDLAEMLGLSGIVPMIPDKDHPGCGMGRYGTYEKPVKFDDFIDLLSEICMVSDVRTAGRIPDSITKAALCTGAGAEFIDLAAVGGADVYVTGDVKYHDARHADDIGFCVIDAGHYGTEILFADNMAGLLASELGESADIIVSETDINPFR
jgi:dinuclear metal center YbgI/SA1388 family protein